MTPASSTPQREPGLTGDLSSAELQAQEATELPDRAASPVNTTFALPLSAGVAGVMLSDDAFGGEAESVADADAEPDTLAEGSE